MLFSFPVEEFFINSKHGFPVATFTVKFFLFFWFRARSRIVIDRVAKMVTRCRSTLSLLIKNLCRKRETIRSGDSEDFSGDFPPTVLPTQKFKTQILSENYRIRNGDIDTILNDFWSWLNSTIKIRVKFSWVENSLIPRIQPNEIR